MTEAELEQLQTELDAELAELDGKNDLGENDFAPKSHQHFAARLEAGFEFAEPKWWTRRQC